MYAPPKNTEDEDVIEGFLELKNGKKVPIIGAIMTLLPGLMVKEMPLLKGKVAGKRANMLQDIGSSTVIVRKGLVHKDELTGANGFVCMIDGTVRRLPEARIKYEIFYSGRVTALCMENSLYDLTMGNIEGARAPHDAKPLQKEPKAKT